MRSLTLAALLLLATACASAMAHRTAQAQGSDGFNAPCVDSAGLSARPVSPLVEAPDSVLLRRPIPPEVLVISPPAEGLATAKSWYREGAFICYRGRRFGPWGYPLVSYDTPGQTEGFIVVYRIGSFDGVPIYAKRDEPEMPEIIFFMLNSAGQYAGYIWNVLMR
jgi:hypothetical protein